MTYQPGPSQPYQPTHPQSPAGWQPAAPPPPKSKALPILIGLLVVAVLAVGGLLVAFLGGAGEKSDPPAAPQAATLTQAGAERACRTALSKEFDTRQQANVDKDIVISVQGVDLDETFQSGNGYTVNGTVRYTLTSGLLDPVQDTLALTCQVNGSDDAPSTSVDNRK